MDCVYVELFSWSLCRGLWEGRDVMVPPSVLGIRHFLSKAFYLKDSNFTGHWVPHIPPACALETWAVGLGPVLHGTHVPSVPRTADLVKDPDVTEPPR